MRAQQVCSASWDPHVRDSFYFLPILYFPRQQNHMSVTKWDKRSVPFFRDRCLIHSMNKRILSISYVAGIVLGEHRAQEQRRPWPLPCEERHQIGEMTGRLGGSDS